MTPKVSEVSKLRRELNLPPNYFGKYNLKYHESLKQVSILSSSPCPCKSPCDPRTQAHASPASPHFSSAMLPHKYDPSHLRNSFVLIVFSKYKYLFSGGLSQLI